MACVCVNGNTNDVQLSTLLRHVMPSCPALPYDMALDMVRQAYIEAARKSNILRAVCSFTRQRGVTSYPLELPDGYEFFAAVSLHRPPHVSNSPHTWSPYTDLDFSVVSNDEIVLNTAPGSDGQTPTELTVVVIPNDCATTMPAEIAGPFGRGIAMGALSEAFAIPNKPWTNAQLYKVRSLDFQRTIASMKNLALTNRGAQAPMFKPVRIL